MIESLEGYIILLDKQIESFQKYYLDFAPVFRRELPSLLKTTVDTLEKGF